MDRNLIFRIMLGLMVFALIAALWWLSPEDGSKEVESGKGRAGSSAQEQVDSTDDSLLRLQRTELKETAVEKVEALASHATARVFAEITTVKNKTGHAPPDCQGWEVTVQYRSEANGPTTGKSACVDASGRVSIELDAYVNVERITCIPPQGSGFGFAVEQASFDLLPQQEEAVLLHITRAQTAFGKVVDHHGEAVADASVHVFSRKHNPGLNNWFGGILTTSTDAKGNFRFEQMPDGAWTFAVQPTRWLMYSPGLEEQSEGHGLLFYYGDEGDISDARTLGVVPMSVVQLSVVGSNGAPVSGHSVTAIPKHFDDPLIKASEEDEFQSVEDILLPYTRYYFRTDENGQANMPLIEGSWELQLRGLFGTEMHHSFLPNQLFSTKQSAVQITLEDPVASLRGQLVDAEGLPVARVQMQLRANHRQLFTNHTTTSNGEFSMPSMARDIPCQLYALPLTKAFLPAVWDLNEQDWEPPFRGVLQASVSLQLRVLDLNHKPHPSQNLSLHFLDWHPEAAKLKTDHADWWRETANHAAVLHQNRPTLLKGLFPGSYTLALMHHSERVDPLTGARPEATEVRRWTLETGDVVHELQVAVPR
ncbi:MAG: carboxypeptidase-like regulatory domain-containing protein [Planctomycetota bacterium]|nr:carboxypeptidase-like regulatory domain-containing protein [Planctomycetota bacterium]